MNQWPKLWLKGKLQKCEKERAMDKLEIYEKVNATKSLRELSEVILEIAGDSGIIEGCHGSHDAIQMAHACLNYKMYHHNALTRMYGIRQQAVYLREYGINE